MGIFFFLLGVHIACLFALSSLDIGVHLCGDHNGLVARIVITSFMLRPSPNNEKSPESNSVQSFAWVDLATV